MIHDLSVVVLPEIHFKEVSVHSVITHMSGKLGIQLLTLLITTLVGVVLANDRRRCHIVCSEESTSVQHHASTDSSRHIRQHRHTFSMRFVIETHNEFPPCINFHGIE